MLPLGWTWRTSVRVLTRGGNGNRSRTLLTVGLLPSWLISVVILDLGALDGRLRLDEMKLIRWYV